MFIQPVPLIKDLAQKKGLIRENRKLLLYTAGQLQIFYEPLKVLPLMSDVIKKKYF